MCTLFLPLHYSSRSLPLHYASLCDLFLRHHPNVDVTAAVSQSETSHPFRLNEIHSVRLKRSESDPSLPSSLPRSLPPQLRNKSSYSSSVFPFLFPHPLRFLIPLHPPVFLSPLVSLVTQWTVGLSPYTTPPSAPIRARRRHAATFPDPSSRSLTRVSGRPVRSYPPSAGRFLHVVHVLIGLEIIFR